MTTTTNTDVFDVPNVTVAGLKAIGISYAQGYYSNRLLPDKATLDISKYSVLDDIFNGCAGIASSVALDISQKFQEVYPQTATAFGINTGLATHGAQTQLPSTPAIMTVQATISGVIVFNIPVNTILSSSSGNLYSVFSADATQDVVIVSNSSPTFLIVSTVNGSGYLLPSAPPSSPEATLTFTPPIVSTDGTTQLLTVEVINEPSNTDGTNSETLANATNRLISVLQSPLDVTRATDYNNYIIKNNGAVVTATGILNSNNVTFSGVGYTGQNCGIYLAGGSAVTTNDLNMGLTIGTTDPVTVFTRDVSQPVIDAVAKQINDLQIIGSRPVVNSITTQGVAPDAIPQPFIRVSVKLQNNYTLLQIIQLDDYTITVENLIKREVRRAICSQKFGASLTLSANYVYQSSFIAVSDIESQLDTTLGTSTSAGTIGSFLFTRIVELYNAGSLTNYAYTDKIPVVIGNPTNPTPVTNFTLADKLAWVYDISTDITKIYSNINVVTLP